MSKFKAGDHVRIKGSFDEVANIRGATGEVAEILPGIRPGYDYEVVLDQSLDSISVFGFEIEPLS